MARASKLIKRRNPRKRRSPIGQLAQDMLVDWSRRQVRDDLRDALAPVHGRSLPKPERKTALTFAEQITAAHLHYVQGIDQHVVAFAMGVNSGRVNEACLAIRKALKP